MGEIAGGCRCGAVRWRIDCDQIPLTYACHCLDCQTWSGSAFSQQAIVARDRFECTGSAGQFDLPSVDGKRISHQFACATCFTRLYNANSSRPGVIIIRAGTFDKSHQLSLVAHIWTRRKQPWMKIDPLCPSWLESAPQGELFQLLSVPAIVGPSGN